MLRPCLKAGDVLGVCAPARALDDLQRLRIRALLDLVPYTVVYGATFTTEPDRVFAAPDALRRADLQALIDDPRVALIWAARGGWGSARIVDQLDLRPLQVRSKWLVGFSDLTTLHLAWLAAGCSSIHAPVLATASADDVQQILAIGAGAPPPELTACPDPLNRSGEATAPLVGGNLSLLVHSLGSRYQPNTRNKILILEEVDEYEYRIDRMIVQLQRAGLLDELAGLAVGYFSRIPPNDPPFGCDFRQIIREHTAHTTYPIAFGLPFGHDEPNRPIILGGMSYRLRVDSSGSALVASD